MSVQRTDTLSFDQYSISTKPRSVHHVFSDQYTEACAAPA